MQLVLITQEVVNVGKEVWVDIDEAPPETMEIVFAQERNRILAQLCQIKNDIDHYNEYRNKGGNPLVFIFDFSQDILEYKASGYDKRYLRPRNGNVVRMSEKRS